MQRALELAATPGVPFGPNPRVGCVILAPDGTQLAEGFHRGAGTPHAEVDALTTLREAGGDATGATAVVTLEPCHHTGRTGPCSAALLEAGVRRVVHAVADPNPVARGGGAALRAAGVDVEAGLMAVESARLNRGWTHALTHGRPYVTWKYAVTLDGRSAAADGTSQWITSPSARADVHRLRGASDVVLAGTGTVLADDPALTVRDADGKPAGHQPLRAVMGERAADVPPGARVRDDVAETLFLPTRDPAAALQQLHDAGRREVFLEGGPALAAAFLRAGLTDEVVAYVAPVLLGAGPTAVADLGITTITDALRGSVTDVTTLHDEGTGQTDVRLTITPHHTESSTTRGDA
ncbi:bifunctional diaminohydroxyphosphoribosylaminopyrimidine deaminase/5-amino-6-(5-phosphoribosylamino)uracil reductase RibD [Nocardioidaceae bacterium]|nr:bifunctional diaminohydroxyphosphoribosylaminopyrimidine deaminase/5-amino-6-(5-phosphoribosylamino)uracil reductase RibD [Nocardioidaceae bacterium]